jgi:hypothetical protein
VGWSIRDRGDTVIHFEDGSYREMDTEEIYNHMTQDYRCKDIEYLISTQNSEETGKLYVMIKWNNGNESILDAELLKKNEPIHLAHFIHNHPVERV